MIVDAIFVGLAFYLMFPFLTAYCAYHYGRSFKIWFAIGCVFTFVSFIVLFMMISWNETITPRHKLSKREKKESDTLVKELIASIKEENAHDTPERISK